MNIEALILLSILAVLAYAIWQHANINRNARAEAQKATDKYGLVLLDQSVLLKRVRIVPSKSSLLAIERSYSFEFSTTGSHRYQGKLVFSGQILVKRELEAYRPAS
jgi:hypothetical protein